MCRTYQNDFLACGHYYKYDKIFRCLDPHCGPVEVESFPCSGWCSSCLNPRTIPKDREHTSDFRVLSDDTKSKCRLLLDLASEPGLQQETFHNLVDGAEWHVNALYNVPAFARDIYRLKYAAEDLISYILDPDVPNLTDDQYELFCEIRTAAMVHMMTGNEILFQQNDRYEIIDGRPVIHSHSLDADKFELFCQIRAAAIAYELPQYEIIRQQNDQLFLDSLDTIMTPLTVPEPDDDPDCPICRAPLWQSTEDTLDQEAAVRLPCRHVFGRDCIESWVRTSETALLICPLCRGQFDLGTRPAALPGNVPSDICRPFEFVAWRVVNEDFQSVETWWMPLLRSTWSSEIEE